jgi:trehalose 6-phosphate phosphatase
LNGRDKSVFAVLPEPRTVAGRAGLAALVAQPWRGLVALDFDGTLAPVVDDPRAVQVLPAVPAILARLAVLVGTLAIITGRPAADAAKFCGLAASSNTIVLGEFGSERWKDGYVNSPSPPPGLTTAAAEIPELLARIEADSGTFVEYKRFGIAVHTDRAVSPKAEFDRLRIPLAALADDTGLTLEPGRLTFELRPPGSDKYQAVCGLARECSPTSIMFCGDDLADRPAFRAVRELRGGGTPGLLVSCEADEVPELAAEADLILPGPLGVVQFLKDLAIAISS